MQQVDKHIEKAIINMQKKILATDSNTSNEKKVIKTVIDQAEEKPYFTHMYHGIK